MKKLLPGLSIVVALWPQAVFPQANGLALRKAVVSDDLVTVTKLATSKALVNSANNDGVTPLMVASAAGRTKTVELLLKAGADVEKATSAQHVTALMLATLFGHLEVAQQLVAAGSNIKGTDKDQSTAIDYAILTFKDQTKTQREQSLAVGKFLKSKGAEVKLTQDNVLGRLLSAYSGDEAVALLERSKTEK